jgi:hypothetical protein
MEFIKRKLLNKLKEEGAFWSYESVNEISDDNLIAMVLIHLDLKDIERLFLIYPKNQIRKVWQKRLIIQEPYYHNLNVLIASIYFEIKSPGSYIKRKKKELSNF